MPTRWRPATSARRPTGHGSAPARWDGRDRRHAGQPAAVGSTTASMTRGLVGDEHLRHEQAVGPPAHRRAEPVEIDGRAQEPAAGERHRHADPTAPGRVDEPAGHERRAVTVLDDGRHEPVVLVAEVRRQPARGRRACRRWPTWPARPGTPSASVTTSVHGPVPGGIRPAGRASTTRAHTSTWASKTATGDHHDQTIGARGPARRARRGVARREDRLRQHEPDAPAVGARQARRRGRGTRRRRRRTGPPPWRLDPPRVVAVASCDR